MGEAISSAAYGVAVALVRGKVTLDDFQQHALSAPALLEFVSRIRVEANERSLRCVYIWCGVQSNATDVSEGSVMGSSHFLATDERAT